MKKKYYWLLKVLTNNICGANILLNFNNRYEYYLVGMSIILQRGIGWCKILYVTLLNYIVGAILIF